MMTAWLSAPSTSLLQILLHHRAQVLAQIGARHAEGDIGAEEAGLGAAIVPLALEFDAIEALGFLKPAHRIGKLDLAAGAVFQRFQDLEDLRLQNVAPGDRQIRWRGALGRLLHHAVDLEHVAVRVALADAADAILVREMRRHFFHRDQIGFIAELARSLDHLLEAARRIQHQLVRQYHREWLVADDVAGAPYRMAEAERRLLPREAHRTRLRLVARQDLHFGLLAARAKRGVELVHPVEMVLDHALVAAGDEDEMFDAGLFGLVDHVLDQWLVDDGQHFLWHRLGGGQDAGAEAGDRKNGFADFHGGVGIPLREYAGSHVGSRFAAANKGGCVRSAAPPHATVNRHADDCSLPPRWAGSGRRRAANAGVAFPPGFPTTKSRFVKLLETVTRPPACRISRAVRVRHGATDGTIGEQTNQRGYHCRGAVALRRGTRAVVRRRIAEFLRQYLYRLDLEGQPDCSVRTTARRLGAGASHARHRQRATAMERRGRRLRPSPDDRERDPRSGGEFRSVRRLDVARRRTAQHLATELPALHRGA